MKRKKRIVRPDRTADTLLQMAEREPALSMNKRPADWSLMKHNSWKPLMAKLALLLVTFRSRDTNIATLMAVSLLLAGELVIMSPCPTGEHSCRKVGHICTVSVILQGTLY